MARLGIARGISTSGAGIDQWLRNSIRKDVQNLGDSLNANLKSTTPKDTGNARKGWTVRHKGDEFTIRNRVDYIGALNEGSSRQAPKDYVGRTIRSTQIK